MFEKIQKFIKDFKFDSKYITITLIIIVLLTIIVVSIIIYFYIKNNKFETAQLKLKLNETLEKTTGFKNIISNPDIVIVDNKLDVRTKRQKTLFDKKKEDYKTKIFLRNLDNSIKYCINQNDFIIAYNINHFKNIFLQIQTLQKTLDNSYITDTKTILNKIKTKTNELNKINHTILTQRKMI